MPVKVFGHLNPDTDTVTSAIAFAWYLKEKRGIDALPYRLGELNRETTYLLERFGVASPDLLEVVSADDEVVLVDTNNSEELLPGCKDARIIEIVDHHKLTGTLSTAEPPAITIRPVACTATVIWELLQRDAVTTLPHEIAGIMAGAIISDTLNFTSPTTTEQDKLVFDELIALTGMEQAELAEALFSAKSDLTGYSAEQLLTLDSKVYSFGDQKVRFSVLETTKPENALALKNELFTAIAGMKTAEGLSAILFFVVDILKAEAHLLTEGQREAELANQAFHVEPVDRVALLPGVLSRKKQMIPPVEKLLS